jgi:hypothetical protein
LALKNEFSVFKYFWYAKSVMKTKNDLLKLAKLEISGGPKDLSENFDDYLYGKNTTTFSVITHCPGDLNKFL